jgi:hypothetical protein
MNVEELINILEKEVKKEDRENAEIEMYCEDENFEIDEMGGFSLSPDIIIKLKKVTIPVMKPAVFKKEHRSMISRKTKEIKKKLKGK